MARPTRTPPASAKPSAASACSTACPWGSSSPPRGMTRTCTRKLIGPSAPGAGRLQPPRRSLEWARAAARRRHRRVASCSSAAAAGSGRSIRPRRAPGPARRPCRPGRAETENTPEQDPADEDGEMHHQPEKPLGAPEPDRRKLGVLDVAHHQQRQQQHQDDQPLVLQVEIGDRRAVPLGLAERVVHRQRHARRRATACR